jgi:7,8-dihydro-6-hydroxymethylpterin dimethyltransferase
MLRPLNIPVTVVSPTATAVLGLQEQMLLLAQPLRAMNAQQVRVQFDLPDDATILKTTLSLCAECLIHVTAAVYQLGQKVWLRKQCGQHGWQTSLLENDVAFYRTSNKDQWGRQYDSRQTMDIPKFDASASCCGPGESCGSAQATNDSAQPFSDQKNNKSCTVLVEVTDACNLACKVCYADSNADANVDADTRSRGNRILPLHQFKDRLNQLIAEKGGLDSIQITGGEASLHPQFWELLEFAFSHAGIHKVYLPTNGLLFNRPDMAQKLVRYKSKVLVLLQFDGEQRSTNQRLRAADPLKARLKLIQTLDKLGIAMQLTMTIARGVNEQEIAWVVGVGRQHRNVRLVALQPAFFSGRVDLSIDPTDRACLSDAVKGVTNGLGIQGKLEDFLPIPCSHPNCGWVTLFARRFGFFANIARQIDLNAVMNDVAYKTLLDQKQMQQVIGSKRGGWLAQIVTKIAKKLIRPKDVFGIAIKPFMDRFNYDQDRVSSCCHHMFDTRGDLISFCEYNARFRHGDLWANMPKLEKSVSALTMVSNDLRDDALA